MDSDRWRKLTTRKMAEVDAVINRAEHMKHLLEESLDCGCLSLDAYQLVLGLRRGDPLCNQQGASISSLVAQSTKNDTPA